MKLVGLPYLQRILGPKIKDIFEQKPKVEVNIQSPSLFHRLYSHLNHSCRCLFVGSLQCTIGGSFSIRKERKCRKEFREFVGPL